MSVAHLEVQRWILKNRRLHRNASYAYLELNDLECWRSAQYEFFNSRDSGCAHRAQAQIMTELGTKRRVSNEIILLFVESPTANPPHLCYPPTSYVLSPQIITCIRFHTLLSTEYFRNCPIRYKSKIMISPYFCKSLNGDSIVRQASEDKPGVFEYFCYRSIVFVIKLNVLSNALSQKRSKSIIVTK